MGKVPKDWENDMKVLHTKYKNERIFDQPIDIVDWLMLEDSYMDNIAINFIAMPK